MKSKAEWKDIIEEYKDGPDSDLKNQAFSLRVKEYGKSVYLRGLIEFTNFCKNNCYYCGLRLDNKCVKRYRLTEDEILSACENGYNSGFKTFVLQGGEDPWFTDDKICSIVSKIKEKYPDCAVTLSIGEKSRESYLAYFNAGADRFLLRHETANAFHYSRLHPENLSLENRKKSLYNLREIGYQVGAGFMVGSPFQTLENLAEDMVFLEDLNPHMVGIGPFIPHKDTPFKNENSGKLELTLTMLCLVRIALPKVLLPATTALATLAENGREQGFECGANVIMPNLSPLGVRKDYSLYNNKKITDGESAESIEKIRREIEKSGLILDFSRGDSRV